MRWNAKLALTAAWTMSGTFLYLMVPTVAPLLLPLTILAPILWSRHSDLFRRLRNPSRLVQILAVASAYLAASAVWFAAPAFVFAAVAMVLTCTAVLHVLINTMPSAEREPLHAMVIGHIAGYACAALIAFIDIAFEYPIHLFVYNKLPSFVPRPEDVAMLDGVPHVAAHFLNKHMAALAFLLWPTLLMIAHLVPSARRRAAIMACLLPVIPAVFLSAHETSKVALAGGAIVFFCTQALGSRFGRPLVVAGWTIACLATPPLASSFYYNLELHKAAWLPMSARARIVIWGITSEKTMEAPVFGHGIASARKLGRDPTAERRPVPDTDYVMTLSLHAHNAYLQAWLEVGAVGVLLLWGIGFLTLQAISTTATGVQPALYAAFAGNALLAASSFSLWANWFQASLTLSAIFAMLAWCYAASTPFGAAPSRNTLPQSATPYTQ